MTLSRFFFQPDIGQVHYYVPRENLHGAIITYMYGPVSIVCCYWSLADQRAKVRHGSSVDIHGGCREQPPREYQQMSHDVL